MARSRTKGNLTGIEKDPRRRYTTLEAASETSDGLTPLQRAQLEQGLRVGPVLTGPIGVNGAPGADFDVYGDVIARQSLRVHDGFSGIPAGWAGKGVEVIFVGGDGYVQSFDRTAGTYQPLLLVGSTVSLTPSGSPVLVADASGVNNTGVYKVAGTQVVGARQAGWPGVTPGTYPIGAVYSQAEVTALANAIVALENTVDSLIGALRTHGLLGI